MKKSVRVLEQNEELYRSALWTMRGRYWQIVSLCIKVPFDFVLLSPHREATLSPWNDCARYIYTCSPRISWARTLSSAKLKTHQGGRCLKCIGSVLSNRFISAGCWRRNGRNESVRRNGWASHFSRERRSGHSEVNYNIALSERYVEKLKTVTQERFCEHNTHDMCPEIYNRLHAKRAYRRGCKSEFVLKRKFII